MKRSFYLQLFIGLAFVLLSEMSYAGHFKTVWSGNPYNPMNFVIQKATINGTEMVAGDEIAVFDVDGNGNEICVGVTVLTQKITSSNPATLVAGEDDGSGQPNGFIPGHKIIYRLWDAQNSREITTVFPTYNATLDSVFTDRGTVLLTSLSGFSPVETSLDSLATCPGQVVVPILVKNMNKVGSFALVLNTDPEFFHYTGYQNMNDSLSGNVTVQDDSGAIRISWHSSQSATIGNDTLLELKFDADTVYTQITRDFTWDTQNSYYATGDSVRFGADFIDGKVTIHPLPVTPDTITGPDSLYKGSTNITYKIRKLDNATSYGWSLSPSNAGAITGADTAATVNFSDTFTGMATLSVYGKNPCGNGKTFSAEIHLFGFASASAGANDTVCGTKPYQLNGSATNYKRISWETLGDGSFDDSTSLSAVYTPGDKDSVTGSVRLVLTAYALLEGGNNASDTLTLFFVKVPIAHAGANDTICAGKTYTLHGSAENYSSIQWKTSGDGSFSNNTNLNAVYTPGPGDITVDSVILTLQANPQAHCNAVATDNMVLYIRQMPEKPETPQGPTFILQGTDNSTNYTIAPVKYAKDYTWHLQPSGAGSISGTGTTGTVAWNSSFTGTEAYVFVTVSNGSCGSNSSDSLKVRLSPVGIPQHPDGKNVLVAPNPTRGNIVITLKNDAQDYELFVINAVGRTVMKRAIYSGQKQHQFPLNLGELPTGIYYLRFVNKNSIVIKKVLITK